MPSRRSSAWEAPGRPRNRAIAASGIVVSPEWEDDLGSSYDLARSRVDDAHWARELRRPFTWHLFTLWWVARRWVMPRDPRRSLPPRIVERF